MSRVLILSIGFVAILLPALVLGQASQSGDLLVNSPARGDIAAITNDPPAPVAPPIVLTPVAGPTTQPEGSSTVLGQTDHGRDTRPTAAATQPEIYRSAIEKMPIRAAAAEGTATPATQPAQTTKLGLSPSGINTAVQVGGALFIVVGLIFIARAMARKWVPGAGASSGKNVIEILARYPLAKAQSLVMVRIGSQIVVLNQTREASTSVLVISEQTEVANILGQIQGGKPTSIQAGFTKLLANAQMDLEREEMPESDAIEARMQANQVMEEEQLDDQLDEMAAAKRQLMELRTQVRTIRESLK